MSFSMKDIQQLDDFSYVQIDKIIEKYEDTRSIIEGRLKKNYGEDALTKIETYERYSEFLNDMPDTKQIKRWKSILKKIREDYIPARDTKR